MSKAGIYIYLYHGRKSPDEKMEDWGDDGPTFGPYNLIGGTYTSYIVCSNNDNRFDMFSYSGDCLYYDEKYYGDFSIFTGVTDSNYPEIEKMQAPARPVPAEKKFILVYRDKRD